MRIAICDRQKSSIDRILGCVKKILSQRGIEVSWFLFNSGRDLLQVAGSYDIVFLGADTDDIDGLETGRRLREREKLCKIILIAERIEQIKEAFKFQTFRLITRPVNLMEVREAVISAIENDEGSNSIDLYYNRNVYSIPQKDIMFVRAFNGYTEFKVRERIYRREESLAAMVERLDSKLFYQVGRKYIINMSAVSDFDGRRIVIGEEEILIPTRLKKVFEKQYLIFMTNT